MRVIAGIAGGLRLKSLEGRATRPTADRIKESLFNIIAPVIKDTQVLDLFAGTGALGIEALSRGAGFATFIDHSRDSVEIIKQNLEHTGFNEASEVYSADFENGLRKLAGLGRKYDMIFLDPPYGKKLEIKAVELLNNFGLMTDSAIIIIECEQKESLPDKLSQTEIIDERNYGRTAVRFYRYTEKL